MLSVDKLNDHPFYYLDYILKQGGDYNPQCDCDQLSHPTSGKSKHFAFQLTICYIFGDIVKFHVVLSASLLRLGQAFFQGSHSFVEFAIDHFNDSKLTIDLLVCRC